MTMQDDLRCKTGQVTKHKKSRTSQKKNKALKLPNDRNDCNAPCFPEIGSMETYINKYRVIERVRGAKEFSIFVGMNYTER